MSGLSNPTYSDLIECLETLEAVSSQGHVPESHLDLYYHARDLAQSLDPKQVEGVMGIEWFVENRDFEAALNLTRERGVSVPMVG